MALRLLDKLFVALSTEADKLKSVVAHTETFGKVEAVAAKAAQSAPGQWLTKESHEVATALGIEAQATDQYIHGAGLHLGDTRVVKGGSAGNMHVLITALATPAGTVIDASDKPVAPFVEKRTIGTGEVFVSPTGAATLDDFSATHEYSFVAAPDREPGLAGVLDLPHLWHGDARVMQSPTVVNPHPVQKLRPVPRIAKVEAPMSKAQPTVTPVQTPAADALIVAGTRVGFDIRTERGVADLAAFQSSLGRAIGRGEKLAVTVDQQGAMLTYRLENPSGSIVAAVTTPQKSRVALPRPPAMARTAFAVRKKPRTDKEDHAMLIAAIEASIARDAENDSTEVEVALGDTPKG